MRSYELFLRVANSRVDRGGLPIAHSDWTVSTETNHIQIDLLISVEVTTITESLLHVYESIEIEIHTSLVNAAGILENQPSICDPYPATLDGIIPLPGIILIGDLCSLHFLQFPCTKTPPD